MKGFEIGQIRRTEGAADGTEMKINIGLLLLIESLQKVAAQLFTARATEAVPAPDSADGMFAPVSFLKQGSQLPPERFGLAQCLFDLCGFRLAQ